jgi:hypothetical protein
VCDYDEHSIAQRTAVQIVDAFEVVEVNGNQHRAELEGFRAFDGRGDPAP